MHQIQISKMHLLHLEYHRFCILCKDLICPVRICLSDRLSATREITADLFDKFQLFLSAPWLFPSGRLTHHRAKSPKMRCRSENPVIKQT